MRPLTIVLCLVLPGAPPAFAADKPGEGNAGLHHPEIVAVRNIFRSVERDIARRLLQKQQRTVEGCSPLGEERTIFSDGNGRVRKYVWEGGSSDSAVTIRQYYDDQGRMRFVFIMGGAVNGTELEHRIYLDERGARIRETRDMKAGPGWTFPQFSDEEGLLARAPLQAYEKNCDSSNSP
jgi:hypothetical protein